MFSMGEEPQRPAEPVEGEGPLSTSLAERFGEIALPHLDAVYRLARALASSEAEAEDLVQETWVRAYNGFAGFELRAHGARPWLFRILYNTFYTLKGKQRREPALLDQVDFDHFVSESSGVEGSVDRIDGLNWEQFDDEVKSAIEQLRPEYRSVLLLWSIEGLSYKEIATVCGCALGTVMSRLYRARRAVARQLREYAQDRRWPSERLES